jgi:MFS family permease
MLLAVQRSLKHKAGRSERPGSRLGLEASFLLAYGLTVVGIAMSLVDATATASNAGNGSNGAAYTSIYLATLFVTTALAVPTTPKIAARFGPPRAIIATTLVSSVLWLVIGALVLAGFDPMPVLVIGALGIGALSGVFMALIPLFAKAYFPGATMAGAQARLSIPGGVAWAIGAGIAGLVLHRVDPGWGLIIRAVLGVPLTLLLVLRPPAVEPLAPEVTSGAWAGLRTRLQENAELRKAVLLGCGIALVASPLLAMIVPITDALEHKPPITGASTVIVTMSIGQMFAPVVVAALERTRTHLRAAALAGLGTAVVIAAYGITALIFKGHEEPVIWAVVGLFFGALLFAGNASTLGAATDAGEEKDAGAMVATYVFATSLAPPVGVLIWGLLISQFSVEAALLVGAAGTALVSGWFARMTAASRRRQLVA